MIQIGCLQGRKIRGIERRQAQAKGVLALIADFQPDRLDSPASQWHAEKAFALPVVQDHQLHGQISLLLDCQTAEKASFLGSGMIWDTEQTGRPEIAKRLHNNRSLEKDRSWICQPLAVGVASITIGQSRASGGLHSLLYQEPLAMNRRDFLRNSTALSLSAFPLGWTAAADGTPGHVLVYTRSQAFEHSVVHRPKENELSLAERIVTALGKKHGFQVTCSKDGREFLPDNIKKYDAFLFETTGDLTQAKGTDSYPPMPAEGKIALLKAIASGKGFVGCHCASDTFHSPGDRNKVQEKARLDPYIAMLGGEFIVHGAQQKALMRVVDNQFPGTSKLKDFPLNEEWYALKNFAPDLHVILVQETEGMKGGMYERPSFPATWARKHDKGRVFYTSMGHREDVWENPLFQDLLLGALSWGLGQVEADVTPNIDKVTPKASELKKS